MPVERIIAVDFGTSTSVVRVKRYQDGQPMGDRLETKPVTFNMGSTVVPTLIQKRDTQESLYFGYDAEIPHRNTEICRNFKIEIENPDPAIQKRARGLTAEFFGFLFKTYREQSLGGHLGEGSDQERTIISYPVKWSEETKAFMLETARKAGFPNVEGQDEAQAAIQAVTVQSEQQLREKGYFIAGMPANILLIDMGAGTTDLVLCRHTPGDTPQTEILSTWPHGEGALFGGGEVDELLRNYIKSLLPVEDADKALKKLGADKFKAWKEHEVSPALARGETVDYFSALDDRLEDLEIDVDYSIDRQVFEDFAQDYLRGLPELINGCLQKANVNGDDVDLVIVTGGHSQWYFVREVLNGKLNCFGDVGLQKIQADPGRIISVALPQETVALGLVYTPLQVAMPKPAPKSELKPVAEQEQKPSQIIAQVPPVLHTSRLVRPDRPVRPVLPGKNASIEEIKAFYRKTQWAAQSCYLQCNGTIVNKGLKNGCTDWGDIVVIAGMRHIVGLQTNGTVVADGINNNGQCNVQEWRDIVAVACGYYHTVGLRTNGTVVAVGVNDQNQCDTHGWEWRDIIAITCGNYCTAGLRADSTVVTTGFAGNTEEWYDIIAVVCGFAHVVGLKSDGTVVATGNNTSGQCDVQSWRDIIAIDCGADFTVGLRSDGTVVAVGSNEYGQCDVQRWKNVLSISCTNVLTNAILEDGSVIRTDCRIESKSKLFGKKETIYHPLPTKTLPFKLF